MAIEKIVKVEFQWERHEAEWWELHNPILRRGEPGLDTTTGWFRVGDGESRYLDLEIFKPASDVSNQALLDHINSQTPHPVYDDGPSLELLYQNAKV